MLILVSHGQTPEELELFSLFPATNVQMQWCRKMVLSRGAERQLAKPRWVWGHAPQKNLRFLHFSRSIIMQFQSVLAALSTALQFNSWANYVLRTLCNQRSVDGTEWASKDWSYWLSDFYGGYQRQKLAIISFGPCHLIKEPNSCLCTRFYNLDGTRCA